MRVDHGQGFTIGVPEGWKVMLDPSPEVAMVALAPPDSSGFSRNVTVTGGSSLPEFSDLETWRQAANAALVQALEDFQLIDVYFEPEGGSFRQLISYVSEGRALTLEQWVHIWDRHGEPWGATVSVTIPTLSYATFVDEATEIAGSWRLKHERQQ